MKPGQMDLLKNRESRYCEESAAADDAAISIRWETCSMRLPRSLWSLAMTTNGTLSTLPFVRVSWRVESRVGSSSNPPPSAGLKTNLLYKTLGGVPYYLNSVNRGDGQYGLLGFRILVRRQDILHQRHGDAGEHRLNTELGEIG